MSTIRISEGVVDAVRAHAARAYPDECCGALLGRGADGDDIVRAVPLENESAEPHSRRFFVSPDVVRFVERRAESEEMFVVGFYHSHPDAPAVPSQFDNQHAVSWLLSIIVACSDSGADALCAYEYDMDTRTLVERSVDILPAARA